MPFHNTKIRKQMEKIYRQVSVKDRLPKQDGNYWCKMSYIDSALYQQNFKAEFGGFGDNSMYEYWLEEVELPSDEDIKSESKSKGDWYDIENFIKGANYILNTLKGEKK